MKRKYIEAVDLTALGEGEMVALASTFGDVDKHGDRVVRGAYSTDVAKVKAGASLPLVWGHDVNGSPQNFVGEIHDADETDQGLEVRARFDLDDPVARKAYRLVKQGAIDKLSIGYRVRRERRANDGVNELLDIELHEVSLVLSPANERARVLAIKDAPVAVRSDAALRQQGRVLGIEPPLTRRQLRRRSDEVALEHALGWEPPPKLTPESAKSVPTAAQQRRQWDRLRLELLTDDLDLEAIEAARDDPAVPTDAELREQAKALGLPGPPPRRHPDYTALRAASQAPNADALRTGRRPMNMLQGFASKSSVKAQQPARIASFEC
jgi:HK97 family phage prohead protease